MKYLKQLSIVLLTSALVACGGGGGNASAPVVVSSTPTLNIASILITSVDPNIDYIKADGLASVGYTVRALDSGNNVVPGATISFSASNGLVSSKSSVTTDADGKATVLVTANPDDQTNRIGTLAAACSGCSASVATKTITVLGASLLLSNPNGANLVAGGGGATLSAEVKNATGKLMAGVQVSFASTDPLKVNVASATVTTDAKGVASVSVSGVAAGSASVNVTALGAAAAQGYTAGAPATALTVTSPANNAALNTNSPQTITVSAPGGATSVLFASNLGVFGNGLTSQVASVSAGVATAVLTVPQAGVATVTLRDNLSRTANLKISVSPAVSAANKVLLTVNQTTLALATAQNTPTVRIRAQAIATVGASDQSVANVPIAFTMTGGPGGGEYLSTSFQLTDSSGYAYADFYSGTAVSIANGISIGANIQGTSIHTGTGGEPSSGNVVLTIGGQALSVAFGSATVLRQDASKTLYLSDHSVIVTDANNNPVANATVTLRVRPVEFSLGTNCSMQFDAVQKKDVFVTPTTYCSEDINGNGSLDAGEDGVRVSTSVTDVQNCSNISPGSNTSLCSTDANGVTSCINSSKDGLLTPQNSVGGAVPATVVTGADGTASFTLTYLKASAIWVVDRLTATVSSSGTETSGSTVFRLRAVIDDVTPICLIPDSPFAF